MLRSNSDGSFGTGSGEERSTASSTERSNAMRQPELGAETDLERDARSLSQRVVECTVAQCFADEDGDTERVADLGREIASLRVRRRALFAGASEPPEKRHRIVRWLEGFVEDERARLLGQMGECIRGRDAAVSAGDTARVSDLTEELTALRRRRQTAYSVCYDRLDEGTTDDLGFPSISAVRLPALRPVVASLIPALDGVARQLPSSLGTPLSVATRARPSTSSGTLGSSSHTRRKCLSGMRRGCARTGLGHVVPQSPPRCHTAVDASQTVTWMHALRCSIGDGHRRAVEWFDRRGERGNTSRERGRAR